MAALRHDLKMLGVIVLALIVLMLLRACASQSGPDVQRTCLPMHDYGDAKGQAALVELKREYDALPASSTELRSAMRDYEALRDANRASCGAPAKLGGGL